MKAIGFVSIVALAAAQATMGCTGDEPQASPGEDGGREGAGWPTIEAGPPDAAAGDAPSSCPTGSVECSGACVVGACAFAVTSIDPVSPSVGGARDWVNGGTFFVLHGNGFAKGMHVLLGDGRAAVRVADAQTATIQAPPGAAGTVDVTISLGSATGITKGAFTYLQGSVDATTPWSKVNTSSVHGDVPAVAITSDGRALVTGGLVAANYAQSAYTFTEVGDLFSLAAPSMTVPAASTMHTQRWNHSMVTLLTGQTMVVSAAGVSTWPTTDSKVVDLFDPSTNSFVLSKATPLEGFQGGRSILLVDGRVLVTSYAETTAEIYDPDSDSFSAVPGAPSIAYYQEQGYFYLARLRDGRVLLTAGQGAHAYLFDSDAGTFTDAGPGPAPGPDGVFTLPDGRVVAVGGSVVGGLTGSASAEVWIFDPKAGGGFVKAGYSLLAPRAVSATAMQRDGSILVVGGSTGTFPAPYTCGASNANENVTAQVDRVDPVLGTVTPFAALPEPNSYVVAATLLDGSVVVAGGGICGATAGATLYPYVYFRQAPHIN